MSSGAPPRPAPGPEDAATADPGARPALGAVAPSQRLHVLDVLRGFAILGILFVNVHFYSRPIYAVFRAPDGRAGPLDGLVESLTTFLVAEKFFSILSVLFGLGMAIMYQRATDRGVRFGPLYLRRLAGLFAIGVAHALLLYAGDFIGNYALLGLPLYFFRNVRPRALLAWSAAFLLVPCLIMAQGMLARPAAAPAAVQAGAAAANAAPTPAPTDEARQAQEARRQQRREALQRRIDESVAVYGRGTVAEIFRLRAREVVFQYSSLLFVGWKLFAMFLVGLWCWRSGLVPALERRLPFVRRVMWIALLVGLVGCSLGLYGERAAGGGAALQLGAFVGQEFGAPALALFYMAALVLLYFGGVARPLLDALAPVGRMAMSNYAFQSLVCALLFHSYGLGLFGRTSNLENVLIAVALGVAQVFLSRAWLRRFAFGPLEWLLRRFVYRGRPAG
ncbi:MAG: DUF418 domain-containing protein [Acidobacteria bacterium]|jgi:uncharacterized protein|nr:DUF418 domain-containing protein [Acidobacteriota bacterium]